MKTHRIGARGVALAFLALAAAAVAFVHAPGFQGAVQDDGFIYFRIAENAAHGRGPVFNPGDRVDAATSPAWLWLLAAAARLGVPLPLAAGVLGLLATLAATVVAARWALELSDARRPLDIVIAAAFPAALAVDARVLSYAFSGMETMLAALAWLWATRSLVRRWWQGEREPRAGFWVLAAGLVRPEYALVVLGLALLAWRRGRQSPTSIARTLAPALAGTVLYLAAHTLYYGTPWPNTWIAKRQGDLVHARIGAAYVAGVVRTFPWIVLGFAAFAFRPLRAVAAAIAAGLALYTAHLVSLGGDHFMFHRPFIVVLPVALALAGAAAAHAMRSARSWAAALAILAAVATLAGAASMRMRPGAFDWVRDAAQLGYALARTYPPATRVGLFAIGATGYTSHLPVVDALGLADRHVARSDLSREHACALDIGHERGDPAYVLANADVIVPFAAYSPVQFESLEEVRDGFHSHKKFLQAARAEVASGRLRLRNLEFAPGAYWLVLERARGEGGTPRPRAEP